MKSTDRLRVGILAWYKFKQGSKVLCVADDDVLGDFLKSKGLEVVRCTIKESADMQFLKRFSLFFDYVIIIGMLEYCFEPKLMLECWKCVLKREGCLLLGTNNRMGIRFFCGDRDPITGKLFDGIENYRNVPFNTPKSMGGRLYSGREVFEMLLAAGIKIYNRFSVFPDLNMAHLIYAQDYIPNEDLAVRIIPKYNTPDSVYLDEQHIYHDLIENDLFHQMANAYIFECTVNEGNAVDELLVQSVTISLDRDKDKSYITIIYKNGTVEKKAFEENGKKNLKVLAGNMQELRARGIKTVDTKVDNDSLIMPFVDAPSAVFYLRSLLFADKNKFIKEMDRFRSLILQSSDHISDDSNSVILKHGFVDMVPINAFYVDDEYVFFDQEFVVENYPANAIIFRLVAFVYDLDHTRETALPQQFFFERYGIDRDIDRWIKMSVMFTDSLRTDRQINAAMKVQETAVGRINENKDRINRINIVDETILLNTCFSGLENKQLYLFGSGKYADKFYACYHNELKIAGVLDNNPSKWGTLFMNLCIHPPRVLETIDKSKSKVIICIHDYTDVYWQLKSMGITNIGLYNANYIYPGRQDCMQWNIVNKNIGGEKKYHIGYIAGVFDLFHIGHINLFRRAKEQCDYLVVGVVSDEQVRRNKKKEPFVPFEERLAVVRACRYVDEANEIPINYSGTVEAFQKYHFDVQFSGNDYINDSWWLAQKKYLEEHGAELVFFPYTEGTSSTMLQSAIRSSISNEK